MCNECECDTDADLLHQYMGLVAKALDTPALIDERRIQSNFPLAFSKRQKIQQPIGDELPSVILPPPAFPKQPRSRLAKAKVTTDPKTRANREEEERQRQAMITGGYLAEANMPSARQALLSLQPERALAALALAICPACYFYLCSRLCSRLYWIFFRWGLSLFYLLRVRVHPPQTCNLAQVALSDRDKS